MIKPILIIIAIITCYYHSKGQSPCAQTLRLAQSEYNQGRLHTLPELLESCLRQGFNSQEKASAYKLLVLTYIYLEEPEKADLAMLFLLRINNEFQINGTVDPAEFVALYRTFRTSPVFTIGGKFGVTATQPSVTRTQSVNEGITKYSYRFGFSGTIAAEFPFAKKRNRYAFNPELGLHLRSFTNTNKDADSVLVTTAIENQAAITLPLSFQFRIAERKSLSVYVSTGTFIEYLLSATKRVASYRGKDNSPVEEKSFDIIAQRNRINAGLLASAGLKSKIRKGYFIVEIRFQIGLIPYLTKADTYKNLFLITDYKNVDGIFRLNSCTVSLGYVLSKYKPKKLHFK